MNSLKQKFKVALASLLLVVATLLVFIESGVASIAPWLLLVALIAYPFLSRQKDECAAFLIWKDEYSVGIKMFDQDHKRLLNLINNLRAAVLCNTGGHSTIPVRTCFRGRGLMCQRRTCVNAAHVSDSVWRGVMRCG